MKLINHDYATIYAMGVVAAAGLDWTDYDLDSFGQYCEERAIDPAEIPSFSFASILGKFRNKKGGEQ